VLDEDGRPVPKTLLEIWQCNAAGRYQHERDQHDAPLDPHFLGVGQVVTNEKGEWRVLSIRPGAYPWRNTHNAWRAAHIHFSIFGPAFATRIVTQMYFPGDPLIPADPIVNSVSDQKARESMICSYDPELSEAEYAMGYRWDIVLRGRDATPTERA
jgi:protocatechuate 3,4-dioxygenase beta subunit